MSLLSLEIDNSVLAAGIFLNFLGDLARVCLGWVFARRRGRKVMVCETHDGCLLGLLCFWMARGMKRAVERLDQGGMIVVGFVNDKIRRF